jgi:hypothetical protein
MTKAKPRPPVPVDAEQWSEESRRGLEYLSAPDHYEDIPFDCHVCRSPSVFTAEQQKYTFETKKAYIWQRRLLCASCHRRRNELSTRSATALAAWTKDRARLKTETDFLDRWKRVLEELPAYGVRKDTARISMLGKLLEDANGIVPTKRRAKARDA